MGKRNRSRQRAEGIRKLANEPDTLSMRSLRKVLRMKGARLRPIKDESNAAVKGFIPLDDGHYVDPKFVPTGTVHLGQDVPVTFEGKRIGTVTKLEDTPGGLEVEMNVDKGVIDAS